MCSNDTQSYHELWVKLILDSSPRVPNTSGILKIFWNGVSEFLIIYIGFNSSIEISFIFLFGHKVSDSFEKDGPGNPNRFSYDCFCTFIDWIVFFNLPNAIDFHLSFLEFLHFCVG